MADGGRDRARSEEGRSQDAPRGRPARQTPDRPQAHAEVGAVAGAPLQAGLRDPQQVPGSRSRYRGDDHRWQAECDVVPGSTVVQEHVSSGRRPHHSGREVVADFLRFGIRCRMEGAGTAGQIPSGRRRPGPQARSSEKNGIIRTSASSGPVTIRRARIFC